MRKMPGTVAVKLLKTGYFASVGSYLIVGFFFPVVASPLYPFDAFLAPISVVEILLTLATFGLWVPLGFAGLTVATLVGLTHRTRYRTGWAIEIPIGAAMTSVFFNPIIGRLENRMEFSAHALNAECLYIPSLTRTLSQASWFDGRAFSEDYYGVMQNEYGTYVWSFSTMRWEPTSNLNIPINLPCSKTRQAKDS